MLPKLDLVPNQICISCVANNGVLGWKLWASHPAERRSSSLRLKSRSFIPTSGSTLGRASTVITVVFDFNPDKHDPEPWNKMTRLAPVDFIGTPDSVAVQIYSLLEIIRGAVHCYTGLSGFQKGILMFHVVAVDGVFQTEDGPSNAMIEETQRQLIEALQQISEWPMIERRKERVTAHESPPTV